MKLQNSKGLCAEILDNGLVASIEAGDIRISLKKATRFSYSGANIWLRVLSGGIRWIPLTGPASRGRFTLSGNTYTNRGSFEGIDYRCTLELSASNLNWYWRIGITNHNAHPVEADLVYIQDAGLKSASDGLVNEYYVSQYLERRILDDPAFGAVAVCRQNMREKGCHPWFLLACRNGAISGATDGMQVFGKSFRLTGVPEFLAGLSPEGECAGESPVFALQSWPAELETGETAEIDFAGMYLPDHPEATSQDDLSGIPALWDDDGNPFAAMESLTAEPESNLFLTAPLLLSEELTEEETDDFFGKTRRFAEYQHDQLLSFFTEDGDHVVTQAKEALTDRPHAHIMQARSGFVPDERIMSTTAFMSGIFNSHIHQGNTNFNVLLSVCTSQFNQSPESGQRIFARIGSQYYRLGVPSAFETGLNHCRWIYKTGGRIILVRSWTSKKSDRINMDLQILRGDAMQFLVTHDFDPLNGWKVMAGKAKNEFMAIPAAGSMISGKFPDGRFRMIIQVPGGYKTSGDELLFHDHRNRGTSLFSVETGMTRTFGISFIGEVCGTNGENPLNDPGAHWEEDCLDGVADWRRLSRNMNLESGNGDVQAIREILPWFGMNAMTHFLTPYGLEQFSGAAWGTRDVSQGPVDLLLTMEKYEEARKVLCTIFSNQDPRGGWPQWWMFDSYAAIRAHESHGDIFYWCLIALGNYIRVTGDATIMEEVLPYRNQHGELTGPSTPLQEHVERLVQMITASFLPGTALVPFGGGDWNDSLQPVSQALADRMISSWTVEMNYQAFMKLHEIYGATGDPERAEKMAEICNRIRTDFNKHLIRDGVVAGYGLLEEEGMISVLLHPSDRKTGIQYSLLPMNRGIISGIFSREQAEHHQALIEKYLKGPDGARLMDRPLRYKGGLQEIFQRAESSTFFGREIGLMYTHEHLRYAEALAETGKADAFVQALRQAMPVGYREIVPCSDWRQANCYYSSSDVTFRNRYEADECYDEVIAGHYPLKGGWRVYSSGPGIFISLIVQRLLGLRIDAGLVIMDPVMPLSFDGLTVSLTFQGKPLRIRYSVKTGTFSPRSIRIKGKEISFSRLPNAYRAGGAAFPANLLQTPSEADENVLFVEL